MFMFLLIHAIILVVVRRNAFRFPFRSLALQHIPIAFLSSCTLPGRKGKWESSRRPPCRRVIVLTACDWPVVRRCQGCHRSDVVTCWRGRRSASMLIKLSDIILGEPKNISNFGDKVNTEYRLWLKICFICCSVVIFRRSCRRVSILILLPDTMSDCCRIYLRTGVQKPRGRLSAPFLKTVSAAGTCMCLIRLRICCLRNMLSRIYQDSKGCGICRRFLGACRRCLLFPRSVFLCRRARP